MEILLYAILIGIVLALVFGRMIPRSQPTQIIYVQSVDALDTPTEAGCLPIIIFGVVVLVVLSAMLSG
jgi:hypothetical protein